MKKSTANIILGVTISVGLYYAAKVFVEKRPLQTAPYVPLASPVQLVEKQVAQSQNIYSIEELAQSAPLIVTGTVVAQNPHSAISVLATVNVKEVLKGEPPDGDSLQVFQLGKLPYEEDSLLLAPDAEYLLFLGRQDGERANIFFVEGGQQGAFRNADGKIVQADPRLPAAALTPSTPGPTGMSEFEAFVDTVRAISSSTSTSSNQ